MGSVKLFYFYTSDVSAVQGDFDTSLVHRSSIVTLHRFGDIARFCAPDPSPIPPYFGGLPVAPHRPCWGQPETSLKLIIIIIISLFVQQSIISDNNKPIQLEQS